MIYSLTGSDLGVIRNKNHTVYEWRRGGKRVVFSATKMGDGLSCHFAAEKDSLRILKTAINEFCEWAFDLFGCKMILAQVKIPSVGRLIRKCQFEYVRKLDDITVYMRKPWADS